MTMTGRNRRLGLSVLLALSALLLLASTASATSYQRPLKEVFGPVEQPAFHAPYVIAADRETGDVLVGDGGGNAIQIVSFSGFAEGDLFTLANLPTACGGSSTEIEYSISTGTALRDNVRAKLEEECGAGNTSVSGSAASGIKVQFIGALAAEPMPLMSCAVVAGHGGGGCSVEVFLFGAAPGIYRFHADGTPAPFAALGTNRIDGEGSGTCAYPPTPSQACDKTPQDELGGNLGHHVQIAIDESGGPTDGNIYVTQNKTRQGPSRPAYNVVDIFSAEGKYLGQVTSGVAGYLTSANGVAVDAEGNLYISGKWKLGAEFNRGIGKCHPSGAFPVDADCTDFLPLPDDLGEGRRYEVIGQLALGVGPSAGSVFITATIKPPGVPVLAKMDLATGESDLFAVGYGGAGLGGFVAVNPTNGAPVVRSGEDATELVEFDGSGETAGEPVSRLRADASERIEWAAFNSGGDLDLALKGEGLIRTYGAPAIVPTVAAGEATEVTTSSATLNGTVNPSGLEVSACRLEALPESEAGQQTNEVQQVTFSGATGGTFTLGLEGQTTTALAYGVNAVEVQAALAALPAIGAGNVSVGEFNGYRIEFSGALAAKDVAQLEVDASGLTPPGATAEVTTTRQGEGWGNAKVAACEGSIPTDEEDHAVHGSVTGLQPNAVEYTFRLVATNANGTETSYGSFLTAHTVRTDPAEVTGREAAVLKGTVRPEGNQYTECIFEYEVASNPGYDNSWPCDPEAAQIPADSEPHSVTAAPAGLHADTVYRYRIRATNAEGTQIGEAMTFRTFGAPAIEALRASGATQGSATIEADINPHGIDTDYRFEWGTTRGYGNVTPVPTGNVGHGTTTVRVRANLSGLAAASKYHYRVVASNAKGETARSKDQVLETLNSCGLPDGRCLEMVSRREPGPYAQVGEFFAYPEIHFQAAEAPGKLAYVAELGYPDATRGAEILYLGQRDAEGWGSDQLAPPVTGPDEFHNVSSVPSVFLGLSPDLSCGVLASTQPLSSNPAAQLTLEAGGANLYRRNADGTYTLITEVPPQPLEELGGVLASVFQLVGSSADCSKVVFKTSYRYPGLPGVGSSRLYEWTEAGGLRYAGVIPTGGGEEAVEASASGYKALSEDGSRLFFSTERLVGKVSGEVGKTGVFLREGGTTTDVSASTTSIPDEGAKFEGATPDGSRVYFTANHGLTGESSPEGTDLYEYDLEDEKLTDISIGGAGGAQVGGEGLQHSSGALLGVAADGSHVYYIAQGQLVRGQGRTLAANRAADTYSLYDYDSATETVRFVATVTRDDVESVTFAKVSHTTSRVSHDGHYLLFESRADVTGYDSGGAPEAYLYDAEAPAVRPVVCVSCRQDGAATVGSGTPLRAGVNPLYQPLSLIVRAGRPLVFFSSEDSLAPGAAAGKSNLYEWAGGQVFLITAESKAEFLGAAADGTDLYFYARAALNWEDPGGRPAAWDARIGGGFPQPPVPPNPCDAASEGSCPSGPASTPPPPPSAASKSFEGPGNVKPGAKHHKKKHHKRHTHHKRKHKKHKQHKKKQKTKGKHGKSKRQGGQAK